MINNGWKLPWCIRNPVKCMLTFVQKTMWHIPSLAMKDRLSGRVNSYFYFYLLIFILFTFMFGVPIDRRGALRDIITIFMHWNLMKRCI